jgi:proton-coupled amino acid transporter
LYGHFAGEDLEEWDEPITSGMFDSVMWLILVDEEERGVPEGEEPETRPLLKHKGRAKSYHSATGNATMTKAALLLLKSFVGTGVLFLPKAYPPITFGTEMLDLRTAECFSHLYFSLLSPCFPCTASCF